MIENFLNKDVKITVAFKGYTPGGSAPQELVGKIVACDKDFICVEYDCTRKENKIIYKDTAGKVLINRQYVAAIVLL